MAEDDDWKPVAAPAEGDDWRPVTPPEPDPVTLDMAHTNPLVSQAVGHFAMSDPVSVISRGVAKGAAEGFGSESLWFTPDQMKWFRDNGVIRSDDKDHGPRAVFQAFGERYILPYIAAQSAAMRLPNAAYRAVQGGLVELGDEYGAPKLARDIASIPDAFMGSPHPFGIPKLPDHVAAVLDHPVVRDAIENGAVERNSHVPYEAGASAGADTTTHIDRDIPPVAEMPDGKSFPTDTPMKIHEQTEKFVMERLTAGGMSDEAAYKVAHWEYAEKAEDAWYQAQGIDPAEAEKWWTEKGNRIEHEPTGDTPPDLYDKPYPHDSPSLAQAGETDKPTAAELAQAQEIMAKEGAGPEHPPVPDFAQARELGVIGPERPSIHDMAPADGAASAVGGGPREPGGPTGTGEPPPGGPARDPWQERFEQFVGKLKTGDDVKQLIRDAARENGDFLPARQGDIPLSQVEAIAEAAGVEPGSVDPRGLGRLLKNDAEVRTAMQVMLSTTDKVREAARVVKQDGSPEALIGLQEAMMRRDLAVEQVVGLRAEWGRTGRVIQEFLEQVKDQQGLSQFLKDKGRTADGLRDAAHMLDSLDGAGAARFLTDMRKPNFWDKYMFYWVNALISGPVTHAKYVGANAAFAAYEAMVVTPIAGAIGTARRLGGGAEGVFLGEGAARAWGLMAGAPDALRAAWRAARENIQTPLPGEVAKNINPVINQRPNPIGGLAGTIVGIPSRGATGIHSFFNFLGYRAEIEAQAYRAAAKEGLSPFSDDFWRRRGELAANPTPAAMDKAIENGYHLTFISEQGKFGKAVSNFVNTRYGPAGVQPFKLIMPFNHIPGQIMRASLEQTPLAWLDERMRADLTGKNGAVAQDTAHARMIGGAIISGMVVNWALNDSITGYGPTEQTERAIWLRTHEPYSVKVGGYWISYNKFGPIGNLVGLIANLVDVGPKVAEGEYAEASGRVAKATSKIFEDEVGMQGLVNIIEAMEDPDRKMGRFLSSQAATNLPFSSAIRQTASITDPYMREAKSFVDQLRYNVPYARQELLAKRDWLGQPMANPGYGTVIRSRAVNENPIDREAAALWVKPSLPLDRIGGVKLTPTLYDEYQVKAGALTKTALETMVNSPNWSQIPAYVRQTVFHHIIDGSRQAAAAAMQARHPELIQAGIQQRIDHITGATMTERPKRAPAGLQ